MIMPSVIEVTCQTFEGFPGPPGPARPQKRTPKNQAIDISNVRTCANSQIVMLFDRDINKRFTLILSQNERPDRAQVL